MNRRGFLQTILLCGVAPAFVMSAMPVRRILTGDVVFNGPWGDYLNPLTGEWGEHWYRPNNGLWTWDGSIITMSGVNHLGERVIERYALQIDGSYMSSKFSTVDVLFMPTTPSAAPQRRER